MAYKETQSANLIQAGDQELDGDKVDIDTAVSNITPDTGGAEVDDAAQLGAIIAGIDNALGGSFEPNAHASDHIDGGTDVIDGDKLEITWTGMSNYTASTSPAEVDATDQLTAHLQGIDTALGAVTSNDNGMNVTSISTGTTASASPTFDAQNTVELVVVRITAATNGTVNLPDVSGVDAGSSVVVKIVGDPGANNVTVVRAAGDTIDDDSADEVMTNEDEALRFVADGGNNWVRI